MQHTPIQYRFLESLFSAVRAVWMLAVPAVLPAAVLPVAAVVVVVQRVVGVPLVADLRPVGPGRDNDGDHPDSRDFDRDSADYSHSHNCRNS